MAYPTAENSQITDAVSQTNTKILGDAAAMAVGSLFLPTSQALSNAAHNAVTGQQQTFETAKAATVQGVSILLCVDTATTAKGTSTILGADTGQVYA